MADQPQTGFLTLEQLAGLTLIPVAELQKLPGGYLPKPQRGLFPTTEAIKGAFRFYAELRSRPVTVNKDELRDVSGLSDQRHRQLANEGHFPAPIKGRYDLRATAAGLIRYFKELHQRRDKTLGQKRERKLDNENTLLEIDIAYKKETLISVDAMVARLTPAVAGMRQIVLSSTLTEEERDQLIETLGQLLDNAIKTPIPGSSPEASADTEQTATADSESVGG